MGEVLDMTNLIAAFMCQQRLYELNMEFVRPGGNKRAARNGLREYWPHARKAFRWCAERIDQDFRAAIACEKIAGVAGQLLEQERGRHLLIEWRELAVRSAERAIASGKAPNLPDYDLVHDMLAHLTYLGYLHFANGNPVRARETLERALKFGEEHNRHFGDGVAYLHLAFIAISEGNLDEGEALLQKALACGEEGERVANEGSIRIALGVVYGRRNEPEAARAQYDLAVPLYEAVGDQAGLCMALINRGGELLSLGLRDLARADFKRAEAIATELNSPGHIGLLKANIARLDGKEAPEKGSEVFELLRESKVYFARIGDRVQHARIAGMLEGLYRSALERGAHETTFAQRREALWELGNLTEERGDKQGALKLAEQLLAESEANGDDEDRLVALTQVAHRCVLAKHYPVAGKRALQALATLERMRPMIEPTRVAVFEYELRSVLGQSHRHSGDCKGAAREYGAASVAAEAIGDAEAVQRLRSNIGLALADDGRFEEALSLLRSVAEELALSEDYRLASQAHFNVAHVLHLQGQLEDALREGNAALKLLEMIADPAAEEVRRQMAEWK
jgi:tetratricopeptide (TPR) repeat protein